MERHPERLSEGVVRRDGTVTPFNAGDALAAVLDMYAQPVPRQHVARLGKAAKELLEDGFDPQTVCRAMLLALLRARVDLTATIALEIQNATGGRHLSWLTYQSELAVYNREGRPPSVIRSALLKEFAK